MTELTEVWLHMNSFSGPIPDLSGLGQLQNLSLRDNSLTGVVPVSVVEMPSLVEVNLTNNMLQGPMPKFKDSVQVDMVGNTNSGPSTTPTTHTGKTPGSSPGSTAEAPQGGENKSSTGVVVGSVVGGVCAFVLAGFLVVCLYRAKRKRSGIEQHPGTTVIHPGHSGSDQDAVKITVTGSSVNGGSTSETLSLGSSGRRDRHIVEAGNMVKTADTGYISRQLMKALEDLSVHYDNSVRDASACIVQFTYGNDGMDPSQMEEKGGLPVNYY